MMPALLWLGRHFDLRGAAAGGGSGMTVPIPYGIDVAPDGGVWFSQLNEHRIGRIDPGSFAIEMVETPFPGPRRLRFDSQGRLWIPSFSGGLIARFDPQTREFKSWQLPDQPRGAVRAPRRPAQRHGVDLRHRERLADPLRAARGTIHGVPAADARHLYARDRLRRAGARLDLELERADLADRGRGAEDRAPRSESGMSFAGLLIHWPPPMPRSAAPSAAPCRAQRDGRSHAGSMGSPRPRPPAV